MGTTRNVDRGFLPSQLTNHSLSSQCTFSKTIKLKNMISEMQLAYMKVDILRPEQGDS